MRSARRDFGSIGEWMKPSEVSETGDYIMRHREFGEGTVRVFWRDAELYILPTDGRSGPISSPLLSHFDDHWTLAKVTAGEWVEKG